MTPQIFRRMIQFAEAFPDMEIVVTLSRQLSWSHFVGILPIKDDLQRDFYAYSNTLCNSGNILFTPHKAKAEIVTPVGSVLQWRTHHDFHVSSGTTSRFRIRVPTTAPVNATVRSFRSK